MPERLVELRLDTDQDHQVIEGLLTAFKRYYPDAKKPVKPKAAKQLFLVGSAEYAAATQKSSTPSAANR
ncbi:hypothetical protein IQ241_04160 [Romeria aff. gracilis LEGE 07310]|uniref:Uncharacterized protein n=1 Tax=Vasconcelosia minhoensis LEGE 07310 TaxID=915328 RepID=A0A8J7A5X5_9CYAN|nr:hypothetical protein [Romeria gracilis]MBE9076495.1 hypothetical protein [Romeria aff. gracilis LEGE 07310]